MKLSNKVIAGFMALQFLNVQVQSAFGTEATRSMSSEYQQARQTLTSHISKKMESWSEDRQINFAEKMTRLGVKARNKTERMSERKFERRLAKRLDHFAQKNANTATEVDAIDAEETTLSNEVSGFADLSDVAAGLATPTASKTAVAQTRISKDQFLAQLDPTLVSLGATIDENNRMSAPDHDTFVEQFVKVSAKESKVGRGIASYGFIDFLVSLILAMCILYIAVVFIAAVVVFSTIVSWIFYIGFAICFGYVGVSVRVRI